MGVASTLGRVAPFSLVDPDFPQFAGACANGCSGDAAMVAQVGRATLAYLSAPAIGTGAAAVIPRRLAPHNVRSNGVTRLSSAGTRVPTPSSAGRRGPLATALGASSAAFLLTAVCRDLFGYLGEKIQPPPGEPGKAPSTTLAPETFGVTVY